MWMPEPLSPHLSSTPLVSLVHTETLKIVANVLEKDIPLLKARDEGEDSSRILSGEGL